MVGLPSRDVDLGHHEQVHIWVPFLSMTHLVGCQDDGFAETGRALHFDMELPAGARAAQVVRLRRTHIFHGPALSAVVADRQPDSVPLHDLPHRLRDKESLASTPRLPGGDPDYGCDSTAISLGSSSREVPLQDSELGRHADQEEPQPPAAPTPIGRQFGRLAHLAAVAADLQAELFEIAHRFQSDRKGPPGNRDPLLLDWQVTRAPRLHTDFCDDSAEQLETAQQDTQTLPVLKITWIRSSLVSSRGLEHD